MFDAPNDLFGLSDITKIRDNLCSFCPAKRSDDIPDSWCGSPNTESLKDAQARSWMFWRERVVPRIREGKTIMICGHGNIIRSMLKRLDSIPNDTLKQVDSVQRRAI